MEGIILRHCLVWLLSITLLAAHSRFIAWGLRLGVISLGHPERPQACPRTLGPVGQHRAPLAAPCIPWLTPVAVGRGLGVGIWRYHSIGMRGGRRRWYRGANTACPGVGSGLACCWVGAARAPAGVSEDWSSVADRGEGGVCRDATQLP